ncbi:MAG: gamma-glutamyltransferase [Balneolales bacterium]
MKQIPFLIFILLASSCTQVEDESFRVYAPINRTEVSGTSAAVVSDHPLATAAGHEVLRNGGNASDAAVTMAAVLAVVRPHMNGIGGDAFGLFYDGESKAVTTLNASGRAGELATPDFFLKSGYNEIPEKGAASVTVPGAVSAWAETLNQYGTITLAEALEPAIRYAEEGFPVSPTLYRDFEPLTSELNEAGRNLYTRNGNPIEVGKKLRNPALAQTLRTIAQEGPNALYGGSIGEVLAEFIENEGGHLQISDFEDHKAYWTEPIQGNFFGKNLYVHPPNSQGITLLSQLAMAEQFDLPSMGHNSAEYLHTLVEIKKLAFADRDRWVADPNTDPAPLDQILDENYLAERANLISGAATENVTPGFGEPLPAKVTDGDGDTVYLMVVDEDGNAVSWIQSIFSSFGSKVVEPKTGILLHNRGSGFTLQEGHPNQIAPGKQPFHTLTPAMLTDADGNLELTLGTPGGHGQTQSKIQVLYNLYAFNMHPQEAVEAARYLSNDGNSLSLENRIAVDVREDLRNRGHELIMSDGWAAVFGGVQMIFIDNENGVLRTAADPRREGYSLAY